MKCNKCDFTTYKKSLLTKHLYKVHNEGEDIMKSCDLCDYKNESNYKLNQHKEHVHQGKGVTMSMRAIFSNPVGLKFIDSYGEKRRKSLII